MPWDAATVRARGLATHLLTRPELARAAAAGSWSGAARVLGEEGYPLPEAGRLSAEDLDRATSGLLASRIALLARWLGPSPGVLAVIWEDDDRRNLRALLRGSAQGASPGARLLGLSPTPSLSLPALERLARADSPAQLARLLVREGHAAGRPLVEAAAPGAPGGILWHMELALSRVFALRVGRAARRGGRAVRRFAACLIDLENAGALLLAANWGTGVSPADVFLPGGKALDAGEFARIARLPDADQVLDALAGVFAGTPLASAFTPGTAAGPDFERRSHGALLAWLRQEARQDPIGQWVLLWVMQWMRLEARDVRFISAALRMGAPSDAVVARLATPP